MNSFEIVFIFKILSLCHQLLKRAVHRAAQQVRCIFIALLAWTTQALPDFSYKFFTEYYIISLLFIVPSLHGEGFSGTFISFKRCVINGSEPLWL